MMFLSYNLTHYNFNSCIYLTCISYVSYYTYQSYLIYVREDDGKDYFAW